MIFDIEKELDKLPDQPGVYLMKDRNEEVIYVGKAISLRKRVRQYFVKKHGANTKVGVMVRKITSFEYIIVGNEVEALVLESNLIKEKKPRYNVLLRDDKQYPYIRITNEKFPRLMKSRNVVNDGSKYFGPYPSATAVNEIITLMHDIYPIRTCNLDFDKGARLKRPCLNYFIGRCTAPCVDRADEEAYMANMLEVEKFLNGKTDDLYHEIQQKMQLAAEQLSYEQAGKYRDYLVSINVILEKQRITKSSSLDIDLIAMVRGEGSICVEIFFYRQGKIMDRQHFIMDDDYNDLREEIISSFLKQYYVDNSNIPKEIIVEDEPEDKEIIQAFLSEKRGTKVNIHVPKRGEKVEFLEMARKNAFEMLEKHEGAKYRRERTKRSVLDSLEMHLGVEGIRRIEAYDISNISGAQAVGAMIVFENGEKAPKEYRKFKIKTVEGPDDYESLREVLRRRFKRAFTDAQSDTGYTVLPDLILMDGGKGQINVATDILKEFNLSIPVVGLVKDDKHRTRGFIYQNQEVLLKVNEPLYKFLYKVQEEVHRFAINYHRKLREQEMKLSLLDEIPGVGTTRRKALLKHFHSIQQIKKASVEQLAEVPGIHLTLAQTIHDFLRGEQ